MKKIIYIIMAALLLPYFAIMQPVSIDAKTTTYCGAYSNLVDANRKRRFEKQCLMPDFPGKMWMHGLLM